MDGTATEVNPGAGSPNPYPGTRLAHRSLPGHCWRPPCDLAAVAAGSWARRVGLPAL